QVRTLSIAPERILDIQGHTGRIADAKRVGDTPQPNLIGAAVAGPKRDTCPFASAGIGNVHALVRGGFCMPHGIFILPPKLAVGAMAAPLVDLGAIVRLTPFQIQTLALIVAQLAPRHRIAIRGRTDLRLSDRTPVA